MPEEGERVVAIGTPHGLELTVSDGIVSSVRKQEGVIRALQITAPISEGSSGGPVFNMKGEVVGIAAARFHDAENLNFASPVGFLREMHDQSPTPLKVWSEGLIREETASEEKPESYPGEKEDKQKFLTDYATGRGIDYYNQKNYDKALDMFKTAVAVDPMNAKAWIFGGECAAEEKDYGHAAEAFEHAAELLPHHPGPLYRLSDMLFSTGKYQEAIVELRRVFVINPHDGRAWDRIGNCYLALKSDSLAVDAFRTAVRYNPGLAEAHSMLGTFYAKAHNKAAALKEYKVLQNLDKNMAAELWKEMSEP